MTFKMLVGAAGFEPATPCSQSRCANRTALRPEKYLCFCFVQPFGYSGGGGGGIRTRGTCFQVRRFSKPVVSATHPLHLFTVIMPKPLLLSGTKIYNLFSKIKKSFDLIIRKYFNRNKFQLFNLL